MEGPGVYNLDFSLVRDFKIREQKAVQFRFEAFNLLNHPNFGLPETTFGVPSTFGIITSALESRDLQFGLRFSF